MMRARLQVSASSAAGRHAACSSAFRCDTRRLSSLSSLSDITSRVLREGNEQLGGAIPGPSLPALEALTAALPPQPVSIQMVKGAVGNRSLSNRLVQANFIRRELIARRAYILALMHMMPEPLAGRPAVGQLGGIYWERLRELLAMPVLETDEDEREFYVRQKEVNERIIDVSNAEEEQMCVSALDAMQRERGSDWWATHPEDRLAVDRHMDAIFLARIGLRFLLEHYIASATTREGFSGIVENRCSPFALCEEVAAETQALLRQEHKTEEVPHIEVVKVNEAQTFTFVPSHLRLVVGTLLKNSSVATLRQHHRKISAGLLDAGSAISPVRCIVAVSDEAVQLKLEDAAGGIKRSSLINVWSYRSLDSAWWKPADGLSLPLARLYCKYFGGSLAMVPMEGYGTDCYVIFNRLAHQNTENVVPLPSVADDNERLEGLFDAQSRRLGPTKA